MKQAVFLTVMLVFLALGLVQAGVEDEVIQAEKAWATAVLKGDNAALDRLLASQLVYTHSSGVVEDRAEYFGKLKSGFYKYESIQHEGLTVKTYGDAAILFGRVRMKGVSNGQPFDAHSAITHVWVKQGGQWQMAAHQATKLP